MNAEELSQKLYDKMEAEQDAYRLELMRLPPEEILSKAYEYAMREDILSLMEDPELLTAKRCKALLTSSTPLADIYRHYAKMDCTYIESMRSAFEYCAEERIRQQKQQGQAR